MSMWLTESLQLTDAVLADLLANRGLYEKLSTVNGGLTALAVDVFRVLGGEPSAWQCSKKSIPYAMDIL